MKLTLAVVLAFPLSAATFDITAVRVISTTAATTSACNTAGACNGAVIEIDTSSSLAIGGSYTLGFSQAANNDPSTAKIVLTVSGTGYTDCSGSTTTVTRVVYGTKQLRQPYPNAATMDETSNGGTLTLRVFLSDVIYSGETVSVAIGSGLYTSGADSTNAFSGSATNNSTLAYSTARTIANWSAPGLQRITGAAFNVRAVAFQRHAQKGLPVACVVFTATDQHSHTVTVSVPYPAVDRNSGFGDRHAVIEYIASISTSTLDQGDKVTVHFKAYPWVGDSGAVMDTNDGVNSAPHPRYAPQTYVIDKTGAYGHAVAVVDPAGSDSNSCAVAVGSFNPGTPPPACLTINGAAVKLAAFNNANYSRNEASGTMYLQAGNYNWMGASAAASNTTANIWLDIMPFPGVARASVVINGQSGSKGFGTRCTTGSTNCGTPIHVKNVTVNVTSAPVSVFDVITYLWLDGCSLNANGTTAVYQVTIAYGTGNDFGATWANGLRAYSTVNCSWALVRGNELGSGPPSVQAYTVIGNTNTANREFQVINEITGGGSPVSTQPIVAFNSFYRLNLVNPGFTMFVSGASPTGAAIIQNIFESTTIASNLILRIANDSSTASPVDNVMLWHNIIVGGRINRAYNDNGSVARLRNLWSEIGDIRDQEAIKADTFTTADGARVGNWPVLWGVGRRSIYNLEATGLAAVGAFQMEFGGIQSYNPATSGQPPSSGTNAAAVVSYVNRAAYDGTTGGSGAGDYRLKSNSPAKAMMKAPALPFDLNGLPRNLSGWGSAGAYEQAIIMTPAVF